MSITPLNRSSLSGFFSRPRGEKDSTDFAITRFLVPFLCDYQGFAVYMDGDMVCLDNPAELAGYMTLMEKYNYAVRVVKHDYTPTEETKFLGNIQSRYDKKNWSSVMVFNNALCTRLSPEYVEKAPGLELHQFRWCGEHQVAALPKEWNWLIDVPGYENFNRAKLIHYTKGSPCFPEYANCTASELWHKEYESMVSCG